VSRIRQGGAQPVRRPRLLAVTGLAMSAAAACLLVTGATFALLTASMSSGSNSLAAGTVTLTDSAVANCPVSNLLPNATATACTFTATYAGSAAAYLAVNVLIEAQAGAGGTRLYNPGDSANDLQVTITSSNPTVTYAMPTTATTCPGGAPSGSVCYELDNELVSTTAVTSAAVGFSVSVKLPSGSATGYQGGAAQVIVTTHAAQTPAAGSPCTPSGSFKWS
jgi:predicted ribosomally synthesized peptide with SipW-like signal peptide